MSIQSTTQRALPGAIGGYAPLDSTAKVPSSYLPQGTIECSAQRLIFASSGGTSDSGDVGQATGSFGGVNLMQFALTGVPSTIRQAHFRFVMLNNNNCLGVNEGSGTFLRLYKVIYDDLDYSVATWANYKTSTAWASSGGQTANTDYHRDSESRDGPWNSGRLTVATGSYVQVFRVDITSVLEAALADGDTNLNLALTAIATGGQNKFTIGHRTHATTAYRPRLLWNA